MTEPSPTDRPAPRYFWEDFPVGSVRTFGAFSPYLLARAFAGPVLWNWDGEDITGTDTHHFQLGAGASVSIGPRVTLLVDLAALGERAASLGMAVNL